MTKYTVTEYSVSAEAFDLTLKQVDELIKRLSKSGKGVSLAIIKNQDTGVLSYARIER